MKTNLQRLRKDAGYKSAKAFAEVAGVNPTTYTQYEQGLRNYSFEQAWEFADLLHCSLDELVGRSWPANRASCDPHIEHVAQAMTSLSDEGREVAANVVDGLRATYPQGPDTSDLGEETA